MITGAITIAIAGRNRTAAFRYLLACSALAALITPVAHTGDAWFAPMPAITATSSNSNATTWIVLIWLAGAIAFWIRLTAGWILASRMRSLLVRPAPSEWQRNLDQLRTRLRLSRPVRLLISAVAQVPTVVGWLRPIVLLPLSALTALESQMIEALLAHELAHIRRHDYLINLLQSVAESTLFYHPAVWWISHRIREERERCCDDIAVEICGDPLTYARALTEIESSRPEHITHALAANGGALSGRIARLLGIPRDEPRSFLGPAVAIVLLVAAVCSLSGQSTAPRFEVASIKQNKSGGARSPSMIHPGGRFTATNNTVRALILNAYGITNAPSLLSGGPGWIDSDTWDVDAKAAADSIPASATGKPLWDQTRLMLRTLLADRFKLVLHSDTKEMSIYELVVAKGGPKLKPSAADCSASEFACHGFSGNPRRLTSIGGVDTYDIALMLTGYSDRLVVDKTGLTGLYDVLLQWNPFAGRPDQPAANTPQAQPATSKEGPMPDPSSLSSIFDALPQEVGLRLQAQKAPVASWVIDHVERPTEN